MSEKYKSTYPEGNKLMDEAAEEAFNQEQKRKAEPEDRTRDPKLVMEDAEDKAQFARARWTVWHPGDGSQYRVRVQTIEGGPADLDRVLIVAVSNETRCIQYVDGEISGYRHQYLTQREWEILYGRSGYNWWPQVIKPLLVAVGAAR